MDNEEAFLIGPHGQVQRLIGPHGETPPCPASNFKRGDVVKVSNTKALAGFPREVIVAVAIPVGFTPDSFQAISNDLAGLYPWWRSTFNSHPPLPASPQQAAGRTLPDSAPGVTRVREGEYQMGFQES